MSAKSATCVRALPRAHFQAQTGGRTGRGARKNADVDIEMVEAVGIEPTSGCPRPEASTRVVGLLDLGPRGSNRQDPQRPNRDCFSPASHPVD